MVNHSGKAERGSFLLTHPLQCYHVSICIKKMRLPTRTSELQWCNPLAHGTYTVVYAEQCQGCDFKSHLEHDPLGFTGGTSGKESACNAGDPGLIPGSGRSPGEGNENPLQYMGYSAWICKESDMTERLTLS